MSRFVGIDLGTTSSCVAVMQGGVPQVIPNQEGLRSTPSAVVFVGEDAPLVGAAALRQAQLHAEDVVIGVKRLIGRKFDSPECQAFRRFAPFEVVAAANGDAHVRVRDRTYSPPEICALVLAKLRAAAEDYLGEPVEEAIVTVPAYFNDAQRQATRDAGRIAGLVVSRILNEPTAAALAYGLGNTGRNGEFVAVYDLGGGTFDISILEMADGLFQTRATGGNTFLGGDDFDERVMRWLLSECRRAAGLEVPLTPALLLNLRQAAERFKRDLSAAEEVEVVVPFLPGDASGAGRFVTALSRRQYEQLTQDLLDQTVEACLRCLADAQLRPAQVHRVLLVDGQSRAPGVATIVRQVFGREPSLALDAHEAIAMGAAVQAGIIMGGVKDLVLLDVTPHTLGIETRDGSFTPIIERNSTIPTRKSRVFATVRDDQPRVEVHVLQGESDQAAYNKSLHKFELSDLPPARAGQIQIEVGFEIDVNGLVSVEATDTATGRRQAVTIRPSGGLSQADVDRLAAQAREWEGGARVIRDRASLVRAIEGLAANLTRSVQQLDRVLLHEEVDAILRALERAKRAPRAGADEELRDALNDLERAGNIVGRAMLRPQ